MGCASLRRVCPLRQSFVSPRAGAHRPPGTAAEDRREERPAAPLGMPAGGSGRKAPWTRLHPLLAEQMWHLFLANFTLCVSWPFGVICLPWPHPAAYCVHETNALSSILLWGILVKLFAFQTLCYGK